MALAIADELGHSPARVATAWVNARAAIAIPATPIIGPHSRGRLKDLLGALDVALSSDHLNRLDIVSAAPLGVLHEADAASMDTLQSGRSPS